MARVARPVRELGQRAPWLHEGGVRAIAFARDGNVLTAGDRSFRLWMLATGEMARQSERGPREGILHASWFRTDIGRWIAVFTVGETDVVRTWDLATGSFLSEVTLASRGSAMGVDYDGRRLLVLVDERTPEEIAAAPIFVSGEDRPRMTVHVLSIEDGSLVAKLETGVEVACFLADGSILMLERYTESICRVDPDGGNKRELVPPRPPPPDTMPYRANALNGIPRTGGFLVEYSDKSAVFDASGKMLFDVPEHWAPLAFSADGEAVALSASGRVTVFDMRGKRLQSLSTESTPLEMIALSLDKRVIAGARSSGEIHARLPGAPAAAASSSAVTLPGEVSCLAVSPSGPTLYLSCTSGDVLRWKLGERAPEPIVGMGRNAPTWMLARPDGSLVQVTHALIRRFRPDDPLGLVHEMRVNESIAALSPDGRLAALGDAGRYHVLDLDEGEHVRTISLEGGALPASTNRYEPTPPIAISNSGRFAQFRHDRIVVWGAEGARQREYLHGGTLLPGSYNSGTIAFVTDEQIAYADHGHWATLDLLTGAIRIHGKGGLYRILAIDDSRTRIAVRAPLQSGEDGVGIFDLASGECVLECPDASAWLITAFLPDGSIATTSSDRRVILWEAP